MAYVIILKLYGLIIWGKEEKMSSYSIVDEVKKAIQGEAYIAAVALVLTIPDMCCGANSTSGDYVDWFDTYVNHEFLKGTECYALRCSFLHQQTGDINGQRVLRDKELWFTLNVPRNNNSIRVQLYIDDIDNEVEKDKRIVEIDAISFAQSIISGYELFKKENPSFVEEHPRIILGK